jgi:hypothetical protein
MLDLVTMHPELAKAVIPQEHPYLLGSREDLIRLSQERPEAYARMAHIARHQEVAPGPDDHPLFGRIPSIGLTAAIEKDEKLARLGVDMALEHFVRLPVRTGHVRFGGDVAFAAMIYDLCHSEWKESEKREFWDFMWESRSRNRYEEPSVFHNGWYGYKMWGFGLGALASWHENPIAPAMYAEIDTELRERAAPALDRAGAGGGFGEGYYVHYWLYEWLFFCECARRCAGLDYYKLSPKFFGQRAIASMFEMFPTPDEQNTLRPVPIGDGGGRMVNPERDKALAARRILVNYHRNDPAHQAVHAFNLRQPRMGFEFNAYRDFLWHDPTVKAGNLEKFKRSHLSIGPGRFHARSSWNTDATYLYFQAGPRFTTHQHLDQGNFILFKNTELIGDGGHYSGWSEPHLVNYYIRSIAHNCLLIDDPSEPWPNIRLSKEVVNDGGQRFPGFVLHHNGDALDLPTWEARKKDFDTGRFVACEDAGDWVYAAGDITNAYNACKATRVTRQILFLRPNTIIVCDHISATSPDFRKTFLLQAMEVPERRGEHWMITDKNGRLFVQTLVPNEVETKLYHGDELYTYGAHRFEPDNTIMPAPKCRMEISPRQPSRDDIFLHVFTTADATLDYAPVAHAKMEGDDVRLKLDGTEVAFRRSDVGGWVETKRVRRMLTREVKLP